MESKLDPIFSLFVLKEQFKKAFPFSLDLVSSKKLQFVI